MTRFSFEAARVKTEPNPERAPGRGPDPVPEMETQPILHYRSRGTQEPQEQDRGDGEVNETLEDSGSTHQFPSFVSFSRGCLGIDTIPVFSRHSLIRWRHSTRGLRAMSAGEVISASPIWGTMSSPPAAKAS